jgi:hypothetical protein
LLRNRLHEVLVNDIQLTAIKKIKIIVVDFLHGEDGCRCSCYGGGGEKLGGQRTIPNDRCGENQCLSGSDYATLATSPEGKGVVTDGDRNGDDFTDEGAESKDGDESDSDESDSDESDSDESDSDGDEDDIVEWDDGDGEGNENGREGEGESESEGNPTERRESWKS